MTSSQRRQARAQSPTKSLRQQTRQARSLQKRRQTLYAILAVVGVVLVIAAIVILSSIKGALNQKPIVAITPVARTQASGTTMGDPNAPIKVEVWEDFQCPNCVAYSKQIEPQLIDTYIAQGKVYYEYHHIFFLGAKGAQSKSNESYQAAVASLCAADQERFWDYHDMVFANWNGENEGAYADSRLLKFAEVLGLDMSAFKTCLTENPHRQHLAALEQERASKKIDSVPAAFVNGVQVEPFNLVQEIEKALTK